MDIIFKCPHCEQELEVDAGGAGSEIACPSCSETLTIPEPSSDNVVIAPPPPPAGAERTTPPKEEKHFVVPVRETKSEVLIAKPQRPLDVIAKDGDKKVRIKCFKHTDCQEVGRDRFDEFVSEFLEKVGQNNIISINTINYSHVDLSTRQLLVDYGVMIVFKG